MRVFILAAVRLYREGLERCLGRSVDVVGSSGELADALSQLRELQPDIVLLDPGMADGMAASRRIRDVVAGAKVVVLAISETVHEVVGWAEAGMAGYVTRDDSIADLVAVMERAAHGELVCPPGITACLSERLAVLAANGAAATTIGEPRLTARELEIVELVGCGLSNQEIARTLSIALATVKNHIHNVLKKLQVEGRSDAVVYVRRSDLRPTTRPSAR